MTETIFIGSPPAASQEVVPRAAWGASSAAKRRSAFEALVGLPAPVQDHGHPQRALASIRRRAAARPRGACRTAAGRRAGRRRRRATAASRGTQRRHGLRPAADDVVAPRELGVLARVEAVVGRDEDRGRRQPEPGEHRLAGVEPRAQRGGREPGSSERRRGLAWRVRWSWPWSAELTPSPARSRSSAASASSRPAAGGCRVERVGGERGQPGDQVRHAGLAHDRVEAGERLGAVAVRLGHRLVVRELVDAHEEARRAGGAGRERARGPARRPSSAALEHAHGRRRGHAASSAPAPRSSTRARRAPRPAAASAGRAAERASRARRRPAASAPRGSARRRAPRARPRPGASPRPGRRRRAPRRTSAASRRPRSSGTATQPAPA